ncbi:MAG: carboxypeptidase-like regulatory domain-containing protein, partial [Candidatus Heimdallarchaeota archaeon]|nr:carboxypeptidase-like regulatory domain-containing protein [Candidatus Heimdallarchaeota archaeon]
MKTYFRWMILLSCLFYFTQTALAQQIFTIRGVISDAETGDELMGVNISVNGTTKGTTTDNDGFYSFELSKGLHEISFSYIGYKTIKTKINFDKNITLNLSLEPSPLSVDAISVTAEKERIIRVNPNAVSSVSISPRLIEKLPNFGEVDIMRAFQLLPGISASNETSAGLYVRGGTPDQNLILFDGMTI